jgi:hypothetical protein
VSAARSRVDWAHVVPTEPPLRRAYGRELTLGVLVVLAALAVLLIRVPRATEPEDAASAAPAVSQPAVELAAAATAEVRRVLADAGPREATLASEAQDGAREPHFVVEVVDERNAPLAEIPLLVLARHAGAADPRWHGLSRGVELVSDAGGRDVISLALVENAGLHVPGEGALEVCIRPAPGLERGPQLFLPLAVEADSLFRLMLPDASARLYQPLRVRVVDAHGAPYVGVPVRWSATSVEEPEERVRSGGSGTTGADGRAELSLLTLRHLRWDEERSGGTHRFRAEIALALAEPVGVDLGTDPTDHGEIVLVLPDTGSVRVRARRADGTEVVDGATAHAQGWPRGTDVDDEPIGTAALAAGAAEIGLVGLGLTLRVKVSPDDHSCAPGWTELTGPTRAGERVDAAVTLGPERTRLVFRAVDELGAPLAGAELSGELRVERAGRTHALPSFRDVEADDDGRVRVWLDALDPQLVPVALHMEARYERPDRAHGWLRAEHPLAALVPASEHDLGALVLEGPPPSHPGEVLASGVLVDLDTGRPVRGQARLVMSADEGTWEWARSFDTGADGRFELRGPPARGRVALQAFALGYEGVWTEQLGRELVIGLQRE